MRGYILKRVGLAFVVVLLDMTLLGLLVRIVPGDPVRTILQTYANEELIESVRREMGLDKPIPAQVYQFVVRAFQGDLGREFLSQRPVTTVIADGLPHTIILAFSGLTLAVAIGVPLGAYSAAHADSWIDRLIGTLSLSLMSITQYIAGVLLLLVFAVYLDVLPPIGAGELSDPVDYLRHLILPSVALAISWMGYLARLVRASMLEVLNAPYIRTARSLGLRERVVVYKYAAKNALIPTVALLGVGLGHLMGGAIFIEVIFSRVGLGLTLFEAVKARNYPIVQGGVLVVAMLFILANVIADLSYRFLDPRIRVEESRA